MPLDGGQRDLAPDGEQVNMAPAREQLSTAPDGEQRSMPPHGQQLDMPSDREQLEMALHGERRNVQTNGDLFNVSSDGECRNIRADGDECNVRPDGDRLNRIVVSISSDIGTAMAERWVDGGYRVAGTYRTRTPRIDTLAGRGVDLVTCDMADAESVNDAAGQLATNMETWDVLALCAGTMEPIGTFANVDFDEWARSIEVNFTSQLRMLHALLPYRRRDSDLGACVLLMAGGGTNGAPLRYSGYTASKIALIKMCELLDAELPDLRIAIVGPGWVRTKIHDETLAAADRAGDNYVRTLARLHSSEFTRMESVLDCCDWIVDAPRSVVSGRNFSVVHDPWGSAQLEAALRTDPDMYKLRRSGNARFAYTQPLTLAS